MAKSSKKVDAAPVAVVQDKKSAKKGKRAPDEAIEKVVSAKKQKLVKEEALAAKKKAEAKTVKKKKKDETSSDDDSEFDSDEEPPKAVVAKNGSVPVTKKKDESSDGSDSDDSSDEDEKPKAAAVTKKQPAAAVNNGKKDESSDDSDSEESSEEEDVAPKAVSAPAAKKAESDESDSEEDDSEEESEEEEVPVNASKKNKDVEMVDAATPKQAKKTESTPKTPATQESGGSKTLFTGNLSFKVEKSDVEEFFKEAAEVVDVRFVFDADGNSRGFGYTEFATAEDAKKALELNGGDLLGRAIKLDYAQERGAATPKSRDGGKAVAEGTSAFIRGFDKTIDEETIKSNLQEHFGSCGEITRISVPMDYDNDCSKGIAYIDFQETSELVKALELSGSDLGGFSLYVDNAKPRDGASGGGRGGRGGGFSSGGGRGRGGRGFGDRGGRGGGRRGDRGGGRRGGGRSGGRGGFGTQASGRKTTFD